jgi:signal transduction histidine kinase
MIKKGNKSEVSKLRQKAEELLEQESLKGTFFRTEAETLKLHHELEVHQIELEIQNKELLKAKEQVDIVAQKYTELYNLAPSGFFTLSRDGDIIESNSYGAQMLGKQSKNLKENRFGFFVSDETRSIFNAFLNKLFHSKTEGSCEITLLIDDNLPMYVYLNGIVTKNGEDCFINVMNITDRKLAVDLVVANKELAYQNKEKEKHTKELIGINKDLKELLQRDAEKDLFISILAHDLISPFNSLLGFSEILIENIHQHDISEIETLASQINKSALNTYKLLEDILMWARTQSGKISFNPENLNFEKICKNILEIHKPNAEAKNITLNYVGEDEIIVFADKDMLKAVLRNLVSNAIKFTNTGGQVDIFTKKDNINIIITVSDNGIGIEPQTLEKLFDISQFHTSKGTAEESGTGLGLVLCQQFIEKHGGKIRVESEYQKGSRFIFTLPIPNEQNTDINK